MYIRDDRPLRSLAEDAYKILLDAIEPSEGLLIDDAHDRLHEEGFSDGDVDYAIKRLLDRDYLYEVKGTVFVTEHENETE